MSKRVLARLADIPDHSAIVVVFDGRSIILARSGARVFGYVNRCPHAGYPLQRADGALLVQDERYIVCGAHAASFDLETGACAGGPCNGKGLKRVAVAVRDGLVFEVSPWTFLRRLPQE